MDQSYVKVLCFRGGSVKRSLTPHCIVAQNIEDTEDTGDEIE